MSTVKFDATEQNPKRRAFLAAYANCGNISMASRVARVSRTQHYAWRQDKTYAAAFQQAHDEACDLLEAEVRRRAVDGVEVPVIYQGRLSYQKKLDPKTGKHILTDEPLTITHYSDNLLIFLLKGAMPDKYRENARSERSPDPEIVERLKAGRMRVARMTQEL